MPAGILPFKREHAFTNVSPRYLEIHQKEKREYIPPEPTRYETQRQWQSVSSRYLQGVLHHEQEQLKRERENKAHALSGGDHNNPLAGWEQAESHREYIKRHIGNVGPRYADHFNKQNELQQRRLRGGGGDDNSDDDDDDANDNNKSGSFLGTGGPIRKKRSNEEVEKERGWRGTHALNRHTTFDVMYAKWMKKHADDPFMKRKKNSARSPVGDWLRGKGPLAEAEHSSGGNSFNRSRTPNPDTAKRRAQSPWERSRSSDKFIGGEWKSVSRRNEGFDTIRKQTMYSNPQYRACEKHAAEVISHQRERKVDSSFVPHVASLALAYQIPDSSMMSTINHQSPRSSSLSSSTHYQNNNNTSRGSRQNSPQRNFIHQQHSQSRNNSPAGRRQTTTTTTTSSSMMKMKSSNNNNNNNNNSPSTRGGRNKTAVYNIGGEEEEEQDDKNNNKKVSVIEGGSEEDDDNDLTVPTTTSFSPTENRRQISNSPLRRRL